MTGVFVAAAIIAVPALLFVFWPLLRGGDRAAGFLPLPPDPREQLQEEKASTYRALRELQFEHEALHLSADDYAALRDRYETRAAEILTALDNLSPEGARPSPRSAPAAPAGPWTRRPVTIAISATALLAFGVLLGLGAARYSEPDRNAGVPTPGSRRLAPPPGTGAGTDSAGAANAPKRPVTPEMLAGMLQAARASLLGGRYSEAIAAYQAVLKRDHGNVDALTHLGLIVAIGGHADAALETFERALAIDPNYPPALLYRGQLLYDVKKDYAGAARSWDKFLAVVTAGEEHDRVVALANEARARSRGASK